MDQPGGLRQEGTRQDRLWTPGKDHHWLDKTGAGPSGPIGERKTFPEDA